MPCSAFCISDDPKQPDVAQGFVRAECIEDALVKLSDDRANENLTKDASKNM